MSCTDHVRISRLMDAAVRGVVLTDSEIQHQADCDACQDLFEIFRRELVGSFIAETGSKTPPTKFAA